MILTKFQWNWRRMPVLCLILLISLGFTTAAYSHGGGSDTHSESTSSESDEDKKPDPQSDEERADPAEASSNEQAVASDPCDDNAKEGDPVSLYDGGLETKNTDLSLNGLYPILINRRYDSRSTYDSPLGYGWSINHDRRLYQYPDGSIIIRYACGSRDRFVYTGGAYVTPGDGRQGDLMENPDGSFIYTRQYGTREFYDAQGRLIAVQNRQGHRHEFSYDPAGKLPLTGTSPFAIDPDVPLTVAYNYRLIRIAERAADGVLTGNFVDFDYDPATGRLIGITASDGRSVTYVHDSTNGLTRGNLIQVNGLEGVISHYLYNDPNDAHNLTSMQERAGETPWVSTYDTQDRVVQQSHGGENFVFDYLIDLTETKVTHTIRDAAGLNPYDTTKTYMFDAAGNVEKSRDAEGNEIRYLRDAQGNMTAKQFYENNGTPALPDLQLRRSINIVYDALQRRTGQSVMLDSGETITSSWTYDHGWTASSQVVSSVDPDKIFRTEYSFYRDGEGVPTNIQSIKRRRDDGSFQTTSFSYDAKNRLVETLLPDGQKIVTLYENDSLYPTRQYYEVGGLESPYGQVRYGYDTQGNRDRVWDANNNLTSYDYDDLGRIAAVTNALGEETHYRYSGVRLTELEPGRTLADGEGQLTRLNYTAEGWLDSIEEKDDLGNWQPVASYSYDSAGKRLTASDAQNRTVNYQYDLLGRLVTVTDPLNNSTSYGYDMFHNRILTTDANGIQTHSVYDDLDRVIQVEQLGVTPAAVPAFSYDASGNLLTVTDAEGQTTTYDYDSLSRVRSITQPLGQTVQKFYDARNRIDYTVNARGHKIDYLYEPWGEVSSVEYYATVAAPTPERKVSYSYDHALNLTSVTDDSIQATPLYTYTYDPLNRSDQTDVAYLPAGDRSLQYGYDRFGNQDSLVLNDGAALNHSYSYDKRNRLAGATLPGGQNFAFSYYASGEMQQTTHPNGVTTDYLYRMNGPVEQISVAGVAGTIEQFAYTYDNTLNIDTQTDGDGLHDYDYDGLYRLTQAVHPAVIGLPTENYQYDQVGNREDPSDPALYDYDSNNRITQSPGLSYSFDDDGNMTGRSDGAALVYNKENRLIQFSKGATSAAYQYDPMGRRIAKTVNGITTWYLWDGSDLLAEFDGAGSRQKRYAYLPGDYLPAQMADANGTYNVHGDHLQTPRFLTDDTQQVVWRSFHEAFGKATVDENPDGDGNAVVFNQRFPGQYADGESGLHYNYFRTYDSDIGRYLQSDPIGVIGGINEYLYVEGNPLRLIDSYGLETRSANPWNIFFFVYHGFTPTQNASRYNSMKNVYQSVRDGSLRNNPGGMSNLVSDSISEYYGRSQQLVMERQYDALLPKIDDLNSKCKGVLVEGSAYVTSDTMHFITGQPGGFEAGSVDIVGEGGTEAELMEAWKSTPKIVPVKPGFTRRTEYEYFPPYPDCPKACTLD